MGTLMDCSVTQHGTEWAPPWISDKEPANKKPKCLWNKHYMKNKKKKKRKRKKFKPVAEQKLLPNVTKTIEVNKLGSSSADSICAMLLECTSDNCGKKFTTESALQYHMSFTHERINNSKQKEVNATIKGKSSKEAAKYELSIGLGRGNLYVQDSDHLNGDTINNKDGVTNNNMSD